MAATAQAHICRPVASACNANETSGNTVIGRGENRAAGVDFLRGDVDDVRIFDRALSDAEVVELANQ